jgi:hypothetical protein
VTAVQPNRNGERAFPEKALCYEALCIYSAFNLHSRPIGMQMSLQGQYRAERSVQNSTWCDDEVEFEVRPEHRAEEPHGGEVVQQVLSTHLGPP